jgi:hypothetical protein
LEEVRRYLDVRLIDEVSEGADEAVTLWGPEQVVREVVVGELAVLTTVPTVRFTGG